MNLVFHISEDGSEMYCTVLQENIIQLLGRYYASKGRFPVEFQEKEVMKNTNQFT